jgi:hypothetical protein
VEDADLTSDRFYEPASISELPALVQNLLDNQAQEVNIALEGGKSGLAGQASRPNQSDQVEKTAFIDPGRSIRAISICVIRKDSRILVFRSRGPSGEREFYRPLGGGIHPGETS